VGTPCAHHSMTVSWHHTGVSLIVPFEMKNRIMVIEDVMWLQERVSSHPIILYPTALGLIWNITAYRTGLWKNRTV
jgi:hypothetical protein